MAGIPYIVVLVDAGALFFEVAPIPLQRYTCRTRITVSLGIPRKVSPAKRPFSSFVFLPHRRAGFDSLFFNDPVEHGRRTIGRIPDQALWLYPEAILDTLDHDPGGFNLRCSIREAPSGLPARLVETLIADRRLPAASSR